VVGGVGPHDHVHGVAGDPFGEVAEATVAAGDGGEGEEGEGGTEDGGSVHEATIPAVVRNWRRATALAGRRTHPKSSDRAAVEAGPLRK
jgi:hypothetical protein